MKKYIGRILYNLIGKHLPSSYSKISLGSKKIRAITGKMFIKSGKNINIEKGASIGKNVTLGNNSGIGINAYIGSNTTIGDNVMMGPECVIYTQNHEFSDINKPIIFQGFQDTRPVIIENDVWIGGKVTILPGVHIYTGCVIGAGAVVTKDVPPYSIAAGNPAKVIKKRKN